MDEDTPCISSGWRGRRRQAVRVPERRGDSAVGGIVAICGGVVRLAFVRPIEAVDVSCAAALAVSPTMLEAAFHNVANTHSSPPRLFPSSSFSSRPVHPRIHLDAPALGRCAPGFTQIRRQALPLSGPGPAPYRPCLPHRGDGGLPWNCGRSLSRSRPIVALLQPAFDAAADSMRPARASQRNATSWT